MSRAICCYQASLRRTLVCSYLYSTHFKEHQNIYSVIRQMNNKDILKYRLYNQQITHHAFNTSADVVKWFGAMQAQDYLNALWAIGLRLKNAKENEVEKAIADKK